MIFPPQLKSKVPASICNSIVNSSPNVGPAREVCGCCVKVSTDDRFTFLEGPNSGAWACEGLDPARRHGQIIRCGSHIKRLTGGRSKAAAASDRFRVRL
jgi:hypothetical protein